MVAHGKRSRRRTAAVILQSTETFEELENVLSRSRFDKYITIEERARFLTALATKSIFVSVTENLSACSDPDDDKFLELAVTGGAKVVVTGNKRHFPSTPFRGIHILSPAEFLALELS